jgi:dimethylamine/trimethylamine dehydrogenase
MREMAVKPDFSPLFEKVQIGPVVAPNRFFQVPHCNGMGYRMPRAHAAMRAVKAQGGWGVVCTEEVEIHPSSDLMPYMEGRLWGDGDIPALELMVEAVHQHGALAGIELTHSGLNAANLYSRLPPLAPRSTFVFGDDPVQAKRMDKEDIRSLRRWHWEAALRAKIAGFDIIYCYAGHNMSLAMQFLSRRYNDRGDEYGGSLKNRVRLLRELVEDTREAVGDSCAVGLRLAVDELLGDDGLTSAGEGRDIVAMLADLPDLWDVNLSGWENDSATSRFEKEGYQEPYIAFVKKLTDKPVVGVGRYTSPEAMLNAVKRGLVDLVGAARPSIADPFLPRKIQEGRLEDIRECIGCNICVTGDTRMVPIRCTQNPTMGEEWRRGWHPETIPPRRSDKRALVVGSGPAGLECARALGQRGYAVSLVESCREFGGRVALEASLPGLSEWRRVLDWRMTQIAKLPEVELFPGSEVSARDVLESGYEHIFLATGSTWRRDGIGREIWQPVPGWDARFVYTPDDLMDGVKPAGEVILFDNDRYYMGGVLAELLKSYGCSVKLVTPAALVSPYTEYTLEQKRVEQRLSRLGIEVFRLHALETIQPGSATVSSAITGTRIDLDCDAVVLVTERLPNDVLYRELIGEVKAGRSLSIELVGDALAPGTIASAVYSGHLAARQFDSEQAPGTPFRVERVDLER